MNQNQIQTTAGAGLALNHYAPEKLQVIKNTVAKGATNDELEMFLTLAGRYQLDPFLKEIWFIKRAKKQKIYGSNGRYEWDYKRLQNGEIDYSDAETVIMTSRDGYLKAARKQPDFIGLRASEIKAGDNFSYDPVEQEIQHKITGKRGQVVGAWAIAKAKNREDVVIYVDYDEYKKGTNNAVFDKYPSAMIKKVAEVLALKRQFGLNGLVTKEEMSADYDLENVGDTVEREPDLQEITTAGDREKREKNFKKLPEEYTQKPKPTAEEILKKDWINLAERVKDLRDELGITQDDLINAAEAILQLSRNPTNWTIKELRQVKNLLQDEIKKMTQQQNQDNPDEELLMRSFEEANPGV